MINIDMKLSPPQAEFLRRSNEPSLAMLAGISFGKTRAAALFAVEKLMNSNRLIVAAQNYHALKFVMFREIKSILSMAHVHYVENKSDHTITIPGSTGVIFGASGDSETGLVGLSDCAGAIFDEAALLSEDFYNYISDRCRGENINVPFERFTTSPNGSPSSNWFSSWCKKYPDRIIHATSFDNPFTSLAFKNKLIERYGIGSPMFKQQCLGEILNSDLLCAVFKASSFPSCPIASASSRRYCGVDFAGAGNDESVWYVIDDGQCIGCEVLGSGDSSAHAAMTRMVAKDYNVRDFAFDSTGAWCQGTYDLLKHDPYFNIYLCNFANAASKDHYRNLRTEMMFEAATAIEHGFYVSESESKLRDEMAVTTYFIDNKGRNAIIPKADIKKVLGHSPDRLDAFILAQRCKKLCESNKDTNSVISQAIRMYNAYYR